MILTKEELIEKIQALNCIYFELIGIMTAPKDGYQMPDSETVAPGGFRLVRHQRVQTATESEWNLRFKEYYE